MIFGLVGALLEKWTETGGKISNQNFKFYRQCHPKLIIPVYYSDRLCVESTSTNDKKMYEKSRKSYKYEIYCYITKIN